MEEEQKPEHATIEIKFTWEGRNFVARGFLKKGDKPIDGNVMLARVERAIEEADYSRLFDSSRTDQEGVLPKVLRDYYLATNYRRLPDEVMCLSYHDGSWYKSRALLKSTKGWGETDLVICLCP